MAQQLYAKIKKSSKYYGQTPADEIFPVRICPVNVEKEQNLEFTVHTDSNCYRLVDVNLYVAGKGGQRYKIS